MVGRLERKVAFITGAGRGQGRAHAVRMAEEGAEIIAVDICHDIAGVPIALGTPEDLAQTVKDVESLDRRIIAMQADVRDSSALDEAVRVGVAEFGRLDVIVANAGLSTIEPTLELSDEAWNANVDVCLTGVWRTCKAAVPAMIEAGNGGSVIMTSSVCGVRAYPNIGHYVAAKHGVVGLMKTLALELAVQGIRVNTLLPSNVNTPLIMNDYVMERFMLASGAGLSAGGSMNKFGVEELAKIMREAHALDTPWLEPRDIANGALYLASDEARYVTGISLPIDAGNLLK
jgi:(+)-trans-carveol dehydrogenase